MELTRACQKQYELEQELAFHKIDAKFEPLPYYPDQVSHHYEQTISYSIRKPTQKHFTVPLHNVSSE